jgi:hypothetical protein
MNNWYSYKLDRDDNVMIKEFIMGAYFDMSPECKSDAVIKSLGDNHTELCKKFCEAQQTLADIRLRETLGELDDKNPMEVESMILCAEREVAKAAEKLSSVAFDVATTLVSQKDEE